MPPTPTKETLKDGTIRWRVQFRETPGGTPTSERFATYDGALRFIETAEELGWAETRRIRHDGAHSVHRIPTLSTWLDTYLAELASSATPGTVDDYRGMAERTFLRKLGRYPLDMLTTESVVAWVGWQRQQETHRSARRRQRWAERKAAEGAGFRDVEPVVERYSPKSIRNAQGLLSTALEAAARRYGIINVARGVDLPDDAAPSEMCFLTRTEYARLYAALPDYWRPFVALLAGTGMRWGEATALTGRDFDLEAAPPMVRISKSWKRGEKGGVYLGSPKTRKGIRSVSLSSSVVTAIRDVVEDAGDDELVFTGPRGGRVSPQNFHTRVWQRALAASGLRKRPRVHDLRHSHVSWLIHEGVPLPVIQDRLGHESIQTTVDTYGDILPGARLLAAEAVERAMGTFDAGVAIEGDLLPPALPSGEQPAR